MLYGAIGQQQSIFVIEILPLSGRNIDGRRRDHDLPDERVE